MKAQGHADGGRGPGAGEAGVSCTVPLRDGPGAATGSGVGSPVRSGGAGSFGATGSCILLAALVRRCIRVSEHIGLGTRCTWLCVT